MRKSNRNNTRWGKINYFLTGAILGAGIMFATYLYKEGYFDDLLPQYRISSEIYTNITAFTVSYEDKKVNILSTNMCHYERVRVNIRQDSVIVTGIDSKNRIKFRLDKYLKGRVYLITADDGITPAILYQFDEPRRVVIQMKNQLVRLSQDPVLKCNEL